MTPAILNGEPFENWPDLLTPTEVASIFRVGPKTVSRWHKDGKIEAIKTEGGHRRFKKAEVARFFNEAQR